MQQCTGHKLTFLINPIILLLFFYFTHIFLVLSLFCRVTDNTGKLLFLKKLLKFTTLHTATSLGTPVQLLINANTQTTKHMSIWSSDSEHVF